MQDNLYRLIPKMDTLLAQESILELMKLYGKSDVTNALRAELEKLRDLIAHQQPDKSCIEDLLSKISEPVLRSLQVKSFKTLPRVINAMGIVLHTNLGRAPLPKVAVEAVAEAASGYTALEYDLESGERGSRLSRLNKLLCEITGAEDAFVVNNNAAAVLLTLSTIAKGREVIVSRGELVEIGGGFRIPEVLEQSGAILREVGTTNKTRIEDYEKAINENTCALLKVHKSNYRIIGFTEEASTEELVALCRKHNLISVEDLGSGMLIQGFGEPTVRQCLSSGLDIVTFSGDKLLGGPQAGVILGRSELISKISKNPLARALRIDKMTLAALYATFALYRYEDVTNRVPVIRMLNLTPEELFDKSAEFCAKLKDLTSISPMVVECASYAGGGSLPCKEFKGYAVSISHDAGCNKFAKLLREADPPVITRISQNSVLIDLRTVLPEETEELLEIIRKICASRDL